MAFRGWPAEAVEFYEGLEADNSKTYWAANKDIYEKVVRAPMTELLAELEPEFGEGRIFRPYRDVRFSADKSPYKTAMAATLANGGYIQFSADGLGCGRGTYVMSADQLARYRRSVANDAAGAALERVVGAINKKGIEVTAHERLKSAPRGYARDHPRIGLLQYKGLVAWKQWPVGAWLGTAAAKGRITDFLRNAGPLSDWLTRHVGPAE